MKQEHVRRGDWGRRLEPRGDRVIHGAGSRAAGLGRDTGVIGPTKPAVYMTYVGLKGDVSGYFTKLRAQLHEYKDTFLLPQIGLSMTTDGSPERHYEHEVAEGKYDDKIEILCQGLRDLRRPAFVRIGYEFNGGWNGYEPETYKAAWTRIVSAFRRHRLDEVAAVWCYAPDGREKDYRAYYPGDQHVDWWSVDCFSASHFSAKDTVAFVKEAAARGYPVMIGESTPRKVGVQDGDASWAKWFDPYFRFIRDYPSVKAFCYISWDWAKYPQWNDWGNGRIGDNPVVLGRFQREMTDALYLHGATERDLRRILGLPAL